MRKFDYSFLKKDIPGNIVGLTDIIADLKSKVGDGYSSISSSDIQALFPTT